MRGKDQEGGSVRGRGGWVPRGRVTQGYETAEEEGGRDATCVSRSSRPQLPCSASRPCSGFEVLHVLSRGPFYS